MPEPVQGAVDAERLHRPQEAMGDSLWHLDLSVPLSKYGAVVRPAAEAERKAPFVLPGTMSAQLGDQPWRNGDVSPAAFGLWASEPQTSRGLFDAAFDSNDGLIEVDVRPFQPTSLAVTG